MRNNIYLEPEVIEELKQEILINAIKNIHTKKSVWLTETKELID